MRVEEPTQVCTDCIWMKHSKADWYRGWCEHENKKIDYINNRYACSSYDNVVFFYDDEEEYPADDDDVIIEVIIEGEGL